MTKVKNYLEQIKTVGGTIIWKILFSKRQRKNTVIRKYFSQPSTAVTALLILP